MDGNPPTPKQVAQKYWGNLGYFAKSHYLRRLRGWCSAIVALCSIAVAALRSADSSFAAGAEVKAGLVHDGFIRNQNVGLVWFVNGVL